MGEEVAVGGVVVYGFLNKGLGDTEVFGKFVSFSATVFSCFDEGREGDQFIDSPFVGAKLVLGADIERGIQIIEASCHAMTEFMTEALQLGCADRSHREVRGRDQHGAIGKADGNGDQLGGTGIYNRNLIIFC